MPRVFRTRLQRVLLHSAQRMFLPGTLYEDSEIKKPAATWITEQVFFGFPLGEYLESRSIYEGNVEDEETIARILESQADDGHLVEVTGDGTAEVPVQETVENIVPPTGQPVLDMSIRN